MSKNDSGTNLPMGGLANSSVAGGHYMYDSGDTNIEIGQPFPNQNIVMSGKELVIIDPETSEQVDVLASIKAIEERLLILRPNFEAMKQYPALKDAYEQYKMLEKLLMEQGKSAK